MTTFALKLSSSAVNLSAEASVETSPDESEMPC